MAKPRTKPNGEPNRALRKKRERQAKGKKDPLNIDRGTPVAGTGRPKGVSKK